MMIDIFGRIQYVYELNNAVLVEGERLYVFLKQSDNSGTANYGYLGSLISTLEDKDTTFMSAFLGVATHYALPSAPMEELRQLKDELDKHDRGLMFEGKGSV